MVCVNPCGTTCSRISPATGCGGASDAMTPLCSLSYGCVVRVVSRAGRDSTEK